MKAQQLSIIAVLVLIAGSLRADVVQTLTFTLTTYTQSPVTDNGTNTTAALPKIKTHNTAELLQALAQDEHAAGLWASNSFPSTAKLAVGDDGFVVIKGTNVLLNVSNILSFTRSDNELKSGKLKDSTGLANPTIVTSRIGKFTYDASAIQGNIGLSFYIQGVVSRTETDTVGAGGTYTQVLSGKLSSGTGEGSDGEDFFIITGTVTASGRGIQVLPQ